MVPAATLEDDSFATPFSPSFFFPSSRFVLLPRAGVGVVTYYRCCVNRHSPRPRWRLLARGLHAPQRERLSHLPRETSCRHELARGAKRRWRAAGHPRQRSLPPSFSRTRRRPPGFYGPSEIYPTAAPPLGVDCGARNASSLGRAMNTRLGARLGSGRGLLSCIQAGTGLIDAAAPQADGTIAVQAGGVERDLSCREYDLPTNTATQGLRLSEQPHRLCNDGAAFSQRNRIQSQGWPAQPSWSKAAARSRAA